MEITLKNQNGLDATLHINLEAADYQAEFDKKLQEYRKKVNVPGFRPGKAPVGLVKKMIGNDMKHEVIEHVLQHRIDDYMKENNIKVVLQPLSTNRDEAIDWTKDDYEFSYDIGMKPEVKIDMDMLNKIPMYEIDVEEGELDREMVALRKQHGTADTIETFSDEVGIMAYIKFTEKDDESQTLEGGISETKLIGATEMPEKLKDILNGKQKDYTVDVNIHDVLSNEELKDYLKVEEAALKDIDKMEIQIVNVFQVEDAEMDQNLFDKIFEPGTITNIDDFREEYKKMMAAYFNRESENEWISRMKDKLVDGTKLELPEKMLRRYLLLSYEKETEAEVEDFDKKMEDFRQEMKWVILSDFVSDEHQIEVSEDDIILYTMNMLRNEFSKMGMGELDEATLRQYGINYLSKENNYSRTKMALRDGKVFEQLLSQATPVKESIDREKFEALTKNKSAN